MSTQEMQVSLGKVEAKIFIALVERCDELDVKGLTKGDEWVELVRRFTGQPALRLYGQLVKKLTVSLEGNLVVPNRNIRAVDTKTKKPVWPKAEQEASDENVVDAATDEVSESVNHILPRNTEPVVLSSLLARVYQKLILLVGDRDCHTIDVGYDFLSKMIRDEGATVASAVHRLKKKGCLLTLEGTTARRIVVRPYRISGSEEVQISSLCSEEVQQEPGIDLGQIGTGPLLEELIARLNGKKAEVLQEHEQRKVELEALVSDIDVKVTELLASKKALQEKISLLGQSSQVVAIIDQETDRLKTLLGELLLP